MRAQITNTKKPDRRIDIGFPVKKLRRLSMPLRYCYADTFSSLTNVG